MLKEVVKALSAQGVRRVVVVSNGATWDVGSWARQGAPGHVHVVQLSSNEGSSPAFAAGIAYAMGEGAEFIWLLDDDNQPQAGALTALLDAYAVLESEVPRDRLAVAAFRPCRFRGILLDIPLKKISQRPSTFLGFHLGAVPLMLWRHFRWGRPGPRRNIPPLVPTDFAPYGGLLFHRAVVEEHGLPRADFVLYADDWEFTSRITRHGGTIQVVTKAGVNELESSWRARARPKSPFAAWMTCEDWRAYYGARNHVYVDTHCFPHRSLMLGANRLFCHLILWLHSLAYRQPGRYRLLRRAIRDGISGRLGTPPGLMLE